MKTCNNCGNANPAHADQCGHCRMPGDFSENQQQKEEPTAMKTNAEPTPKVTCTNCGEGLPPNANYCTACGFPVTKACQSVGLPKASALKILRRTA